MKETEEERGIYVCGDRGRTWVDRRGFGGDADREQIEGGVRGQRRGSKGREQGENGMGYELKEKERQADSAAKKRGENGRKQEREGETRRRRGGRDE